MKPLLVLSLVALASCSTIRQIEAINISPKEIYVAAQTFNAVEATATNYVSLPLCTEGQTFIKNQCSNQKTINALKRAIREGRTDRDQLIAWVRENPTGGIGANGLYQGLSGVISLIQTIMSKEGVK